MKSRGQLCDNISVVVVELAPLELESICDQTTYFGYEDFKFYSKIIKFKPVVDSPVKVGQLLT